MPFSIATAEADEWMRCMRIAMTRAGIDEPLHSFLDERFGQVALHMRNREES
jgi:hemoglobin